MQNNKSNNYGMTDYMAFIHTSRYARWLEEENRRETWAETVSRYLTKVVVPKTRDEIVVDDIEEAILGLEIMPSMRALIDSTISSSLARCAWWVSLSTWPATSSGSSMDRAHFTTPTTRFCRATGDRRCTIEYALRAAS